MLKLVYIDPRKIPFAVGVFRHKKGPQTNELITDTNEFAPIDPRLLVTTLNLSSQPFCVHSFRFHSRCHTAVSSNSTSPHYQLYTAEFVEDADDFQKIRFFDIAAQIGEEDMRDLGWVFNDLLRQPFKCPTWLTYRRSV